MNLQLAHLSQLDGDVQDASPEATHRRSCVASEDLVMRGLKVVGLLLMCYYCVSVSVAYIEQSIGTWHVAHASSQCECVLHSLRLCSLKCHGCLDNGWGSRSPQATQ